MREKVSVDYRVNGVANGVSISIEGRGHIGEGDEPGHDRLDIELLTDIVPLGFDPALLLFGGLGSALSLAHRAAPGDPLLAHTHLTILDEGYREVGVIAIASRIDTTKSALCLFGQLAEATAKLEPLERVASVGQMLSTPPIPLGRDALVTTTTGAFEGSFGNSYWAIATTRVVGVGDDQHPGVEECNVALERGDQRDRDHRLLVSVVVTDR